ncbi:SLC13 family permease [Pseudochelatococcus contaminans]|uniref:Anion transporter n=1 Tax=Pseudochelatococcus contaminans TaxID=1538103 RepID=A0A7W5Z6H9_9HYPH|nr:SLC13 family permease [Pseudochelatococcus contaminans]MBB3811091.1 anion transporter [Pseudochelatococcus contaminans]
MQKSPSLPAKPFIAGLVVLAALLIALLAPGGLTTPQAQTLAIVLVTLALWSTGVVPPYLASLIFFAVVLVLSLAAPDKVFAGFGSAAIWLIVSGFVIGAAITISGLGERLAALIGPHLTTSYARLIGGLMLVSMLLGFLMPSSVGRAAVLVPIGMALADRVGFGRGSNGRVGIAVILAVGCNMPSFAILPSNIPNMIFSGAAETIYGVRFSYMEYLILHYPVLGIVKSMLTVWLVIRLFPAQTTSAVTETAGVDTSPPAEANLATQIRVSAILLVTLALWMTDSVHGINAAWIGLVTASILLFPGIGVVPPPAFKSSVDFGTLLFVAGALALGTIVDTSGLGTMFGTALEQALPLQKGTDALNFVLLSVMSVVTGLFTTIPGSPAVLTPMAQDLATQTGLDLQTVLMTQVIGFSTVVFPYQVGPLIVAMQLSGEKLSHLVRLTVPLALITVVALVPLDFLWWRLLGWI